MKTSGNRLRVAKPSAIDLAAHLTKRVFVVPQLLTEERRFATCSTGMSILDPCGCVLAELPSAKVITDGVKLVVDLNNDTLKALASLAEGGECGPVPEVKVEPPKTAIACAEKQWFRGLLCLAPPFLTKSQCAGVNAYCLQGLPCVKAVETV